MKLDWNNQSHQGQEKGFSLAELLIVIALLTVLMSIAGQILVQVQGGYVSQNEVMEAQHYAMATLDTVSRLIRLAGNDPQKIDFVPLGLLKPAFPRPFARRTFEGSTYPTLQRRTAAGACASRQRNHRQRHMRRIRTIMMHRLHRRQELRLCRQGPPGIGIAVKAREVAAGDFQADTVPGLENITGGPQIDAVRIDLAGFKQCLVGRGLAIARPQNAVGQVLGKTAGMHVDQLGGKVRVDGRGRVFAGTGRRPADGARQGARVVRACTRDRPRALRRPRCPGGIGSGVGTLRPSYEASRASDRARPGKRHGSILRRRC